MFTSVAIDFFSISCSLPQVFFVDYGNTHNIMDYNQLRNISESLLEIPFQVNLFIWMNIAFKWLFIEYNEVERIFGTSVGCLKRF